MVSLTEIKKIKKKETAAPPTGLHIVGGLVQWRLLHLQFTHTLMNTLVFPICQSWFASTFLQMRREVILQLVTIFTPGISTRWCSTNSLKERRMG